MVMVSVSRINRIALNDMVNQGSHGVADFGHRLERVSVGEIVAEKILTTACHPFCQSIRHTNYAPRGDTILVIPMSCEADWLCGSIA
jgi:hypothetical protein